MPEPEVQFPAAEVFDPYIMTVGKYLEMLEGIIDNLYRDGRLNEFDIALIEDSLISHLGYSSVEDFQLHAYTDTRIINDPKSGVSSDVLPYFKGAVAAYNAPFVEARFRQSQAAERRAETIAEETKAKREASWEQAGRLREFPEAFGAQAPTGEEAVRTFLEEGRPGAMQGFIESKLPGVLEKYQREQAGARTAWFKALTQPSQQEQAASAEFAAKLARTQRFTGLESGLGMDLKHREATLGRPLTQQDVTYDEWLFLTANERATKAEAESRMYTGMPEPSRPSGEDPLLKYLRDYPWQSEFFKLSPQQRGFNKALYAPSARWFTS